MAGEQQGQQDSSLEFLYTLLVIGIFLVGIWFLWGTIIAKIYIYLRIGELTLVDFVLSQLSKVFGGFYQQQMEVLTTLITAKGKLGTAVDFKYLVSLAKITSKYLQYPVIGLIAILSISLCFSKGLKQFRLIFDTKSLRKLEQYNWPQIAPVTELDLVSTKLDDGPWAMSVSPMVFCKQKKLLLINPQIDGSYKVSLKKDAAYRELALQLGPVWRGIEALPPYLRALFSIFAARINGDKKGAERLLDQIALSANRDLSSLNFDGVDDLLAKYIESKAVRSISSRHAYVTTLMASMLEASRNIGVLSTSEFIWLKPLDRRMWYTLNSVGRKTAMAEICGVFAHWLAEKKLGSALLSPMVDEAVKGLELAIQEIIYKPDDKED